MPASAPQLEPPASATATIWPGVRPGAWPWTIAVLSACALVATLVSSLSRIESAIGEDVRERLTSMGANGPAVALDGRDVTLSGELSPSVDRAALVASVAGVDGVRIVRDALRVIDPGERLREARQRFRDALADIDTGALAFEPGSTALTAGADAALDALAALLGREPRFRVRIAGHTDDTGRAAVNVRLSRERAEAVASRLTGRGVDPARLIATGYGSTQPVADNASAAGRARNRRIEISYVD